MADPVTLPDGRLPSVKTARDFARNRFRVGDRVQFTADGRSQFMNLKITIGTVIGFSRQGDDLVRIRRGRGNPEIYHIDLLEPCDESQR